MPEVTTTRLLNKQRGKSATEWVLSVFLPSSFREMTRVISRRECARTERSRGGKCSKGGSHHFCEFPFVCFEVKFLFQSKRTAVPSGTDETTRR